MVATPRQAEASLRRAAILLNNLDAESRRRLLSHLSTGEANRLRMAVARLADVDPLEVRRVVTAFVGRVTIAEPPTKAPPVSGQREPSPAVDDGAAANGNPSSLQRQQLQFLSSISDQTLLHVVQAEHPQTVAIVLGALPPPQAARLLKRLNPELRLQALRRLGRLEEVPPDVLDEIATHLRRTVGQIEPILSSEGHRTLSSIFAAMDPSERALLVGGLAHSDQLVAQALEQVANGPDSKTEPEQHPLPARESAARDERAAVILPIGAEVFGSPVATSSDHADVLSLAMQHGEKLDVVLMRLKPRDLQTTLASMRGQEAIFVLCGLPPRHVKRFLRAMPRRSAKEIQQRMEQIGSIELHRIDAAKVAAVKLAAKLGMVALPSFLSDNSSSSDTSSGTEQNVQLRAA